MTANKSITVNFPVDERGYVSEVTRDLFFKKIKTRSENRFCMDCKKASPSWVSVTYGTFICLTCSGSHRRMGTHISFVR
jgi:ADP-ribosylation factor GTPase-activating protein 2/3